MAIIQISKIQQRSGNLVDLPQLDEAELGFATDAKKLYIGKELPSENIEVLTSYSNISFSQIDGSVGNLDISAVSVADGQVLTYNGTNWVNRGGDAGGLITLGDVSNVKIDGGAIGYVLETDGTGNLSWTPKGVISAFIENATQADPCVITTVEDNFFTEGIEITITNVPGMTELNGNTYYVDVISSNTFALYSDSGLTTTVDSTGYTEFPYSPVTETFAGSNKIEVGNTALYNIGDPVRFVGTLFGNLDTDILYYVKTIPDAGAPGNITVSTTLGGANVVLSNATGTANVYTVGGRSIADLSAGGGGAPGGSNRSVQFNSNGILDGVAAFTFDKDTNLLTVNGNANVGNLNATSSITGSTLTSNVATGTAPLTVSSTTRVANLNVSYSNVSDFSVVTAQTTGTYFPVLVNGSSTANRALAANSGISFNIATGNLTATILNATGNISGGNLTTTGALSVTGNANVGNLGTAGLITATGNVSGGNITTVGVVSATGNVTGGNLVTSGLANINNLQITGNVAGNLIPNANVTFDLGNNTNRWNNLYLAGNTIYLGSVVLEDDAGALSTGALEITGNANIGNIGVTGELEATGNITGGNIISTGILDITGNANIGNLTVTGNSIVGNVFSNGGLINASSVTVSSLEVDSLSTPIAPSGVITPSGGFLLTGFYYFRVAAVDSNGAVTLAGPESALINVTTNLSQILLSWTSIPLAASYRIYWTNSSGSYTNGYFTSSTNSYNVTTTAGSTPGALPVVNNTGSANISTNITAGGAVTVTGNISGGNLSTAGSLSVTGNVSGGNLNTAGVVSATGNITGGNLTTGGRLSVTSNANVGPLLVTGNGAATGNLTANIIIGNIDVRFGNIAADQWGRIRHVQSTNLYGLSYNLDAVTVITNEESTENQALVLGDSSGTGNIFGITTLSTGNASPTTGSEAGWTPKLSLDGNGNLLLAGKVTATGNVVGVNIIASGTVNAVGNITGANLVTTGRLSVTGNANVGNIGGNNAVFTNITSGGNTTAGNIFGTWTLTGGLSGNSLIVANGNIVTDGVKTDNYFYANGDPLNLNGNYSNSNVAGYLPVYGGNISANNVSISRTLIANTITSNGNVFGTNFTGSGNLVIVGNANVGPLTVTGFGNFTGNVTANILASNNDVRVGNVSADQWGRMRFAANSSLYGFNYTLTGVTVITNEEASVNQAIVLGDTDIGSSGTVFGVSINGSGNSVPTTGTEVGWTPRLTLDGSGNLTVTGRFNANGTVTGTNFSTSGTVSAIGNISGGNLATSGSLTVSGNGTLGNVLATTAQFTNITSGGNTTAGNIFGTWTLTGGLNGNSLIVANGNIQTFGIKTDNYYYANGVPLSIGGDYGNSNVASYLPVYTGNIAANNASFSGNLTTNSVTSNGNIFGTNITGSGNISITGVGNVGSLTVTGNANATGNVTGNILISNNDVRVGNVAADQWGRMRFVASSNLYGFNYSLTGVTVVTNEEASENQAIVLGDSTGTGTLFGVSTLSSGNATPTTGSEVGWTPRLTLDGNGNLTTAGRLVANGNVSGTNFIASGLVSATGNISGANISASGNLAVTGNSNLGNVATANIFSGNGSSLHNLAGSNVVGQVSNALVAGTVYTNAQPNITSVGTLTTLNVNGTMTAINITANGGDFTGNGNGLSSLQASNIVGTTLSPTVVNSSLTSLGTLTSLNVDGSANANGTITGNIIVSTNDVRVGNVAADTWGRMRFVGSTNLYGFNYGLSGVTVITNEEATVSQALVLGDSNVGTSGTVFGISTLVNGNSTPTTGSEVGWTSRLNLDGSGNLTVPGVISGIIRNLNTGANTTPGSITGNWQLTPGSKLVSFSADLAEYYSADQHYEPGTVLEFGGVNEVTIATDGTNRVAGVVSTDPAYAMNAKCPGEHPLPIALQGRVPTKVRGTIRKGDMMVSAGDGYARPSSNPTMGSVIGKALEDFNGVEGVIEIAIGRM